jgi:hypothetical protein
MSRDNSITFKWNLSFSVAVFFIFLVLKIQGVIGWSWWWVTCPLWIMPAITTTILAFICIVVVIVATIALCVAIVQGLID